jgi:hypothetical protein
VRILCQYTNPHAQIRPQRQRSLGDGSIEITQEPIYARFKPLREGAFLYENEELAAIRHFNFHGNTQDLGQAVPTNPIDRMSVFDTDVAAKEEGWDEATQRLVEDRLRRYAEDEPSTFLIVTTSPIGKPFPAYDEYEGDPKLLADLLDSLGCDLEEALYYEKVFGPKRPEIIEALELALEEKRELEVTA